MVRNRPGLVLLLIAVVAVSTASAVSLPQSSIITALPGLPRVRGPLPVTSTSYPFDASAHDATPTSSSSHQNTEDGLAWDMISQVGRLIRTDVPANPLRGITVRAVDLTGWSQSGSYTEIYLNAIARHVILPGGRPIFDGYLSGAGSYAGTPINQCAPVIPAGDPRVRYNPPGGQPVIVVTTPTDFYSAASYFRLTDRPVDSDTSDRRIRLYEIGGGCHLPADHARFLPSTAEVAKAGSPPPLRDVTYAFSSFPLHAVLDAAWANLDAWVNNGIAPPHANRLTVANPSAWPINAVKDAVGNPLGGVRTPAVDVPISTFVERGPATGATDDAYAGYDIPFTKADLSILYPTHQDYVRKVTDDTRRLVNEHWLTPADAEQFIDDAQNAAIP